MMNNDNFCLSLHLFFTYLNNKYMRKILLLASIVAFFASCSSKSYFDLEVNISNNDSLINKQLVITQRIDNTVVFSDTVLIKKKNFVLHIPDRGMSLLTVRIPKSMVNDIIMATEGEQGLLLIDENKPTISGSPINDRLQDFHNGNDSVFSLLNQLDVEFETLNTPNMYNEYVSKKTLILTQNTDRIIAFTKENIDNPIGEYYFLINFPVFPYERRSEMYEFATDKLKDQLKRR